MQRIASATRLFMAEFNGRKYQLGGDYLVKAVLRMFLYPVCWQTVYQTHFRTVAHSLSRRCIILCFSRRTRKGRRNHRNRYRRQNTDHLPFSEASNHPRNKATEKSAMCSFIRCVTFVSYLYVSNNGIIMHHLARLPEFKHASVFWNVCFYGTVCRSSRKESYYFMDETSSVWRVCWCLGRTPPMGLRNLFNVQESQISCGNNRFAHRSTACLLSLNYGYQNAKTPAEVD